MKLNVKQAGKLINIARKSILSVFEGKEYKISEKDLKEFNEKKGIFVSLYVKDELIGCIGFPDATQKLVVGVVKAAQGAAFEDPRFPPLMKKQMKDLKIELNVLTIPKEIEVKKWEDYPSKVKVGRDGLVILDDFGAGLLLPQVAVDENWDSKTFLNNTCRKAGLSPTCWCNMKRNVYKFQTQVFVEKNGKIVETKLAKANKVP